MPRKAKEFACRAPGGRAPKQQGRVRGHIAPREGSSSRPMVCRSRHSGAGSGQRLEPGPTAKRAEGGRSEVGREGEGPSPAGIELVPAPA